MFNFNERFKQQVHGCWLGKAIAGGLGAPFEGIPYSPELTSQELVLDTGPNDDLELQLIWLCFAERCGFELDAEKLSAAWLDIIAYGMDEYGVAIWNLKRGLKPPFTGLVDNWFNDGMGAAIRSEIWACICPGNPQAAAWFAGNDASVDHAGDGVWTEMFLAAAESCAFELDSAAAALNAGLKYIPTDCRAAAVVKMVMEFYQNGTPLDEVRAEIMHRFGSHNFTDCVMNLGFITAALLFGEGDFEKTVLTAVNSAQDTDCSAATAGAMFGILHGAEGIPGKWRQALNGNISVSEFMKIPGIPRTIGELTERTVVLAEKLAADAGTESERQLYQPAVLENYPFPAAKWRILTNAPREQAPEMFAAGEGETAEFQGIHLNLDKFAIDYCMLDLFTEIKVKQDIDCRLMVTAPVGMTVWLDDTMLINYHGRLKPVPAFHRTEGGATVAVSLKQGQAHLLRIRLQYCRPPLMLTAALGDSKNQYITDVKISL